MVVNVKLFQRLIPCFRKNCGKETNGKGPSVKVKCRWVVREAEGAEGVFIPSFSLISCFSSPAERTLI